MEHSGRIRRLDSVPVNFMLPALLNSHLKSFPPGLQSEELTLALCESPRMRKMIDPEKLDELVAIIEERSERRRIAQEARERRLSEKATKVPRKNRK